MIQALHDSLEPHDFMPFLTTQAFGREYHYEKKTSSTNAVLRTLAHQGAPEGALVMAESQSGGRGRLGRSWVSPPGGIWLSLLLRPRMDPARAPVQTLLVAVALMEALKQEGEIKAAIKWPNDVLWEGKKIAGILTEMKAQPGHLHYLIVGVGINVNFSRHCLPEPLRGQVTTLYDILHHPLDRRRLAASFLAAWERYYLQAEREGYAEVLNQWRSSNITLGQKVEVCMGTRRVAGRALDINAQGGLMVEVAPGQIETVLAGEVTLQKPPKSCC